MRIQASRLLDAYTGLYKSLDDLFDVGPNDEVDRVEAEQHAKMRAVRYRRVVKIYRETAKAAAKVA